MKTIISLALLVFGINTNAQISFIKDQYITLAAQVDPVASMKEGGVHFGAEVQFVSNWKYVKAGFQSFTALEGGYLDYTVGGGVNLTSASERTRYYGGLRLGLIQRGFLDDDTHTYPLVGIEGGFDYHLTDTFFIGLRGTGDWREDFKFSDADPSMRISGFVRIGFRLH